MPPRRQSGEGIIIILDVGPNVRASSDNTFYSQSKSCLLNILQRKIFADKCNDMVGIVLFGTDESNNNLAKDNQYNNISVFQEPKLVDWELISRVENLPRGNKQGDWLDAVVVALDLLHDPNDITFSNKKIVLMTDFNTDFSDDRVEEIIYGLKTMEVDLSVIGPSLSEDEPTASINGLARNNLNWNGKVKSQQQLAAESVIKRIVAEVDGIICDFDEAIPQLIFFEKRSQGSTNWNAMMDIGRNFQIPITGRIKLRHAVVPTWKREYAQDSTAAVILETSNHKQDDIQTAVDEGQVISGYRYGSTLVPFAEDDQLQYSCEVERSSLSVLGFTKASNVPFNLCAGDQVLIITAKEGDEDGAVAVSALIQALSELNMVAVTRRIYRKNAKPVLGAMFPDISTAYECLIWIGLPYQEDMRAFTLPSLEKNMERITSDQRDIMDLLIDNMDLSAEDEEDELLNPIQVVNPQLQHFFNCLTQRAISPEEPLPAPQQHVLDLLSTPDNKKVSNLLQTKLAKMFSTRKEEKEKKKKKSVFANDTDVMKNGVSGGEDVEVTSNDLLGRTITKVSTVTPVQDFKALLREGHYAEVCRQMEEILLQFVDFLIGDHSEDRVRITKIMECLKAYREEAAIIDPAPYNSMMLKLKQSVVTRNLNHLWCIVQQDSLGLIMKSETIKSTVTAEENDLFLLLESPQQVPPLMPQGSADYDDMLEEL